VDFKTLLVCTKGVNDCKLQTRKSGGIKRFQKYGKKIMTLENGE